MKRLIHTLCGGRKSRASTGGRPATAKPGLQALEDRSCPAVGLSLVGGTLSITGDANPNMVRVVQDDAAGIVRVDWYDAPGSPLRTAVLPAAAVTNVDVNLADGDDSFTYALASDMTRAKTVSVLLGTGNDQGIFDFGRYKSHAVLADLSLTVRGENGNDSVRADFGDMGAVHLDFLGAMSDGYDTCAVYQWGMLRGSAVQVRMSGGNQDDVLSYYDDNGSWPSSGLYVGMNGDNGNDRMSLFFDDIMTGHYFFALGGGSGNDTILADIYNRAPAPGAPLGDVSVELHGHDGADSMRLHLQDDSGRLPIRLAEIDGGFDTDPDTVLAGTTTNVSIVNVP